MKGRASTVPFITGVLANGVVTSEDADDNKLWYLRPTKLETQTERRHRYTGCKSAGCRTLAHCMCTCKDCKRWCIYRGVTIIDIEGKVEIRFANKRLIVSMPRHEYESIKQHWEKLGLKLQPPAPTESVTPV